jgi:cell wall-associated NlpC family hydrolase
MARVINGLDIPPPGSGNGGNSGGGNNGGGDTPGTNVATEAVLTQVRSVLGAPYKLGAEGPDRFDCSGLVYWAFKTGGYGELMGDVRRVAAGYAHWFAGQGHYTHNIALARRGDLIAFSHNGTRISHIAFYMGNGRIVSALVNPWGVSRTTIHGINVKPVGVCLVQYPATTSAQFADLAPGSESDPETEVSADPSST